MSNVQHIVLASGSPRRRELLGRAGFVFDIVKSDAEETTPANLTPEQAARHIASLKAQTVADTLDDETLVIGADTIVVLDGVLFGKPENDAHAAEMLTSLSGRTHEVITGVCLILGKNAHAFSETTLVTFKQLTREDIDTYIATGEPRDKAGAYGIQGFGGELVDHIQGDYDNVVGLPVHALNEQLEAFLQLH